MRTCDLENWKEALAMALTYAKADEFMKLCGRLPVSNNLRVVILLIRNGVLARLWFINNDLKGKRKDKCPKKTGSKSSCP